MPQGSEGFQLRLLDRFREQHDDRAVLHLDDRQVADLLRRNFAKRINHIARTDVVRHRLDTPITALLRTSARQGQAVVPICDDAGRLKGYCMSNAMLAGLDESLTRMLAQAEQRSHGASPGDKSPEHDSQERDDG